VEQVTDSGQGGGGQRDDGTPVVVTI